MLYEGLKKIMEKLNNELKSEFVGGIFVYWVGDYNNSFMGV